MLRAQFSRRLPAPRAKSIAGLSLVELLVGIALGLFVVAGAATLVAGQLSDTRRLVLEAQVQQDLRATADIVTREIRRSGYWAAADQIVWAPGMVAQHYFDAPASTSTGQDISMLRDGVGAVMGFRLDTPSVGHGVLRLIDSAGNAQDLTDSVSLNVTGFSVNIATLSSSQLACTNLCPGGGQACWPTMEVREVNVTLAGQSVTDPSVKRTVFSNIRLRNDRVVDNLNTPTSAMSGPYSVSTPSQPLCPP